MTNQNNGLAFFDGNSTANGITSLQIRNSPPSSSATRGSPPLLATDGATVADKQNGDFKILASEDDFGEIVFVDHDEERVPELQVWEANSS